MASYMGGTDEKESNRKLFFPAADRNKDVILNVLKEKIGANGLALEISSGTGQHIAHFANHYEGWIWQPSDCESKYINSIRQYAKDLKNVKDPIFIDVTKTVEEMSIQECLNSFDLILNANMVHVTPFECAVGFFKVAGNLLKREGTLMMYGPFAVDGKLFPESNVNFDISLRSQNPLWGIRDVKDLKKLAAENGISLKETIDVPSNNKILVFSKI